VPFPHPPRACVVLLSGGLDSATCLAVARSEGFTAHALAIDYGQRHRHELLAAARLATHLGAASFKVITLDLRAVGGSALTAEIDVPKDRSHDAMGAGVPLTYVPARNLTFLSLAVGFGEVHGALDLFIGVNAVDYSGYPDCRPEFIRAFESAANLGTRIGVERGPGKGFSVHTPLIAMTKAEIIRLGKSLGVDYSMTTSCYDPDSAGRACGRCDSCQLRRKGFAESGVTDPTRYSVVMRDG
jgi:7-cyano-7-deazaguanine synthase